MREVGPGPVSWWRADDPPAPRPVLKAPAPATRWRRRLGTLVLGAAAGLLIANPELRASALAHIERAVEIAGLGLHEVRLVGHRFTVDTDIYAALDLDNARTLLSFNAGAAQARLEQLPWVERASVERVGIDRIDVRVRERVPFALWRSGDRSWLIDRTGRRLQLVPADIMPGLMRVAGDGAPKETAALSGLLADFPQIARRLEFAERVGNRRWTLHLAGGTSVALPSVNEADALVRLGRLMASGLGGASHIDLRVAGRTLVRGLDGGGAAAPAAAAAARRT